MNRNITVADMQAVVQYQTLARAYLGQGIYLPHDYTKDFTYVMALEKQQKQPLCNKRLNYCLHFQTMVDASKFLESLTANNAWDQYLPLSKDKNALAKQMMSFCNYLTGGRIEQKMQQLATDKRQFAQQIQSTAQFGQQPELNALSQQFQSLVLGQRRMNRDAQKNIARTKAAMATNKQYEDAAKIAAAREPEDLETAMKTLVENNLAIKVEEGFATVSVRFTGTAAQPQLKIKLTPFYKITRQVIREPTKAASAMRLPVPPQHLIPLLGEVHHTIEGQDLVFTFDLMPLDRLQIGSEDITDNELPGQLPEHANGHCKVIYNMFTVEEQVLKLYIASQANPQGQTDVPQFKQACARLIQTPTQVPPQPPYQAREKCCMCLEEFDHTTVLLLDCGHAVCASCRHFLNRFDILQQVPNSNYGQVQHQLFCPFCSTNQQVRQFGLDQSRRACGMPRPRQGEQKQTAVQVTQNILAVARQALQRVDGVLQKYRQNPSGSEAASHAASFAMAQNQPEVDPAVVADDSMNVGEQPEESVILEVMAEPVVQVLGAGSGNLSQQMQHQEHESYSEHGRRPIAVPGATSAVNPLLTQVSNPGADLTPQARSSQTVVPFNQSESDATAVEGRATTLRLHPTNLSLGSRDTPLPERNDQIERQDEGVGFTFDNPQRLAQPSLSPQNLVTLRLNNQSASGNQVNTPRQAEQFGLEEEKKVHQGSEGTLDDLSFNHPAPMQPAMNPAGGMQYSLTGAAIGGAAAAQTAPRDARQSFHRPQKTSSGAKKVLGEFHPGGMQRQQARKQQGKSQIRPPSGGRSPSMTTRSMTTKQQKSSEKMTSRSSTNMIRKSKERSKGPTQK